MDVKMEPSASLAKAAELMDAVRQELEGGKEWAAMEDRHRALSEFGTALRRIALQTWAALEAAGVKPYARGRAVAGVAVEFAGLALHRMPPDVRETSLDLLCRVLAEAVAEGPSAGSHPQVN